MVSSGFVSVDISAETEDGTEYTQKNAAGEFCINELGPTSLKWLTAEIELCQVDPEMYNIMTGMPLVMDDAATPNAIGFSVDEDTYGSASFALEIWTDVPGGGGCGQGGAANYGYFLFPCLSSGALGDFTIEDAALTFTLTANTHRDAAWGVGPYNVRHAADGSLAPLLTAIQPGEHMRMFLTDVPPPPAVCGEQPGPTPPPPVPFALNVTPETVTVTPPAA